MAAESIATYRKPGFPKLGVTESAFRTNIEYIGPTATIFPTIPATGATWGDFSGTVLSTDYEATENVDWAELKIVMELKAEVPDESTFGALEVATYEIDWDAVARPLYEHPRFAIGYGGASELTTRDIIDIEFWRAEQDPGIRELYGYISEAEGSVYLSTNAQYFARGIELGQETWEDYAPIARKTSTYVGGPPPESLAGLKDIPTGFANLPTDYEWRKSADRTLNAGSRTRFDRTEEWLGAKKILSDKADIFWDSP
jgi:hypothetical protein